VTKLYPLMPLRDIVIFPHMVAPLVVGRDKSIKALENAMDKKTEILLATQLDPAVEEPTEEDIYTCGTLATVMQLLRLPDGSIKALVEGQRRAKIVSYVPHDSFLQVEVEEYEEILPEEGELIAYERELRNAFQQFARVSKKIGEEVVASIAAIEDPIKLVNVICSHIPLKTGEKQEILKSETVAARMEMLLEILFREIKLGEIERKINATVKQKLRKNQRDYFLGEKIREIQKEIGEGENGVDEMTELENNIKQKKMPKYAFEKVFKEFKKLRAMPAMSAETTVVRTYIDTILGLPWKKKSKAQLDIVKAEKILDQDHYGLEKPKERILEYLAVQAQVKKI